MNDAFEQQPGVNDEFDRQPVDVDRADSDDRSERTGGGPKPTGGVPQRTDDAARVDPTKSDPMCDPSRDENRPVPGQI